MGDYLQLREGSSPWLPSPGAQLVATYDFYNVPTAGILEQEGVNYLFLCVEGVAHPASVWTYTLINDSEREAIEDTPDERFHDALLHFMSEHPTVVALALEGPGIIESTFQEPAAGTPPLKLVESTFERLLQRLQSRFHHPTPA